MATERSPRTDLGILPVELIKGTLVLSAVSSDDMIAALDAVDALAAERDKFKATLEQIANRDWVENVLDPQHAAMAARAALAGDPS